MKQHTQQQHKSSLKLFGYSQAGVITPQLLTATERLEEIGLLLARGFLRNKLRNQRKRLAIRGEQSDECLEPESERRDTWQKA